MKSHHTNSYAHIIEKLNNERVTIFLLNCGDLHQAGVKYYIYIILIPIHLDWVNISCTKNVEIGIDDRCAAFDSSRVLATI